MRNLFIGACILSMMMPVGAFAQQTNMNANNNVVQSNVKANPTVNVYALKGELEKAIKNEDAQQVSSLAKAIVKAQPSEKENVMRLTDKSKNPAIRTAIRYGVASAVAIAVTSKKTTDQKEISSKKQIQKKRTDKKKISSKKQIQTDKKTETSAINNNQALQQTQNGGAGGGAVVGQNATQITASPN